MWQTDRRTDKITTPKTALAYHSAVKIELASMQTSNNTINTCTYNACRIVNHYMLNIRRGQWLGVYGIVAQREGTLEIMCLKMLLKRRQGRAIANFDRDFIAYWRCCVTETSPSYDCGNCKQFFSSKWIVRAEVWEVTRWLKWSGSLHATILFENVIS